MEWTREEKMLKWGGFEIENSQERLERMTDRIHENINDSLHLRLDCWERGDEKNVKRNYDAVFDFSVSKSLRRRTPSCDDPRAILYFCMRVQSPDG